MLLAVERDRRTNAGGAQARGVLQHQPGGHGEPGRTGRRPGDSECGAGRDGDADGAGRWREGRAYVVPAATAVEPAAKQGLGAGGVDGDQPRWLASAAEPLTN